MRNVAELEANIRAIQEKDVVILGMKEQLTKVTEYLATKLQVSDVVELLSLVPSPSRVLVEKHGKGWIRGKR